MPQGIALLQACAEYISNAIGHNIRLQSMPA